MKDCATSSGDAVTPPLIQPSPTHTAKTCSITLSSSLSMERCRATTFGTLEIRREKNGQKTTDDDLLVVVRQIYYEKLRPPFQRYLSARGLHDIIIVEYTSEGHPVPLPMNATLGRDLLHAFNRPGPVSTDDRWINLICGLGEDPHHHYGLLFLEDWDGRKISVLVGVPLVISIMNAIIWIARTGDIQNAMAVSSYILNATTVVVGLLAVLTILEA